MQVTLPAALGHDIAAVSCFDQPGLPFKAALMPLKSHAKWQGLLSLVLLHIVLSWSLQF